MKHLTWAPGSDNMLFIHKTVAIDICLNSSQPTSTKEDTQYTLRIYCCTHKQQRTKLNLESW